MKEHFSSINSIFSYYYFLKSRLESNPSNFPAEERFKVFIQCVKPMESKSIREAMFAFVGDVEMFLDNRLEWWEKFILVNRVVADGDYPRSYGEIVIDIKGESRRRIREDQNGSYPRRLCYRQNVRREFLRLFHRAKDYFKGRGYMEIEAEETVYGFASGGKVSIKSSL